MINYYDHKDIEMLAESGRILSAALRFTAQAVRPGISTYELNVIAEQRIREQGGIPAFLGYSDGGKPYPAALCTSINDEVVHCLPYKNRFLVEGDIISLDLGVNYRGYFTDMAVTVPVGQVSELARKLMAATEESLGAALAVIKPGARIGDIGAAIAAVAADHGFGVIRDLVGHGVGRSVHEDPKIPNYGQAGTGLELVSGMVLAIEPMFTEGSHKIKMLPDGWGIATLDGGLSAHFEKTVAVVENGFRVLTL
jgi:methionyl aminopeptidase